ncbi:MAG: biotin transporter BioY [Candidatus Gastranaerophilales bacterium]|nr:biotin transporter BioY [Candidatus Gastranaerophilales bacterium]
MTKRIKSQFKEIRHSNEKVRFTLGTLTLVALCTFLIIISTFTQFSFNHYCIPLEAFFHPIRFSDSGGPLVQLKYYEYIPQLPVIAYIAALLGPIYGLISVVLYLILGLSFFPVFALGGGIKYVLQYSFGYILAYIPAVVIMARCLRKHFSYKDAFKASFWGVLTIHIIGIFYTIIMALIKREPYQFILEWIAIQSLFKFIYDLIFCFIAIILARITKKFLWIIMG